MTKIDLIWDIDMLLKKEMGSVLYDDPPPFYPWASLRSFLAKEYIFKVSSHLSKIGGLYLMKYSSKDLQNLTLIFGIQKPIFI